jgi:DNA gyrase subunit A
MAYVLSIKTGRATQGVRILNLETDDKVAVAVIIPPEELKDE